MLYVVAIGRAELFCNIVVNIIICYMYACMYTLVLDYTARDDVAYHHVCTLVYLQRRPTSHTCTAIEHASAAVVSMLNQMTDGRSIMQKPKTLL